MSLLLKENEEISNSRNLADIKHNTVKHLLYIFITRTTKKKYNIFFLLNHKSNQHRIIYVNINPKVFSHGISNFS